LNRRVSSGVAETVEESNIRMQPDIASKINEVYKRLGAVEIVISISDGIDDVVMTIAQYLDDFVAKTFSENYEIGTQSLFAIN
jgi:hypothetical protein